MAESIAKTAEIVDSNQNFAKQFMNYFIGICYFNGEMSHKIKLSKENQEKTDTLDQIVLQTKPISKPLYLFHGFEVGIFYGDDKWKIGEKITFPFHLSKTPAIWVADRFTNHFSWYLSAKKRLIKNIPPCYDIGYYTTIKTLFVQKYLFCIYEESDRWHHVSTDMRCPTELYEKNPRLIANEEFEYLSHKNEQFELVDTVYKFNFGFPLVKKFYILKRI